MLEFNSHVQLSQLRSSGRWAHPYFRLPNNICCTRPVEPPHPWMVTVTGGPIFLSRGGKSTGRVKTPRVIGCEETTMRTEVRDVDL